LRFDPLKFDTVDPRRRAGRATWPAGLEEGPTGGWSAVVGAGLVARLIEIPDHSVDPSPMPEEPVIPPGRSETTFDE
jgi:hypothetical protein